MQFSCPPTTVSEPLAAVGSKDLNPNALAASTGMGSGGAVVPGGNKGRQSSAAANKNYHSKSDPPHPLQDKWSLYVLLPSEKRTEESWQQQQIMVHSFSTVEDFWCMYHYIHPPSQIGMSDYSLFKRNIMPAWEDPAVAHGGRWVVKLPPKVKRIDEAWLEVVLAMIGENFRHIGGDSVAGSVVAIRARSQKLALWMGHSSEEVILAVGREFRKVVAHILEGIHPPPNSPQGPHAQRGGPNASPDVPNNAFGGSSSQTAGNQGDVKPFEFTFEPFDNSSPRYVLSVANGVVKAETIVPDS